MIKLELTISISNYLISFDLFFISFCVVCDWCIKFETVQIIESLNVWNHWIPAASWRHVSLSIARGIRSSTDVWTGSFISKLSWMFISNCARRAQNIRFCESALSMWINHFKRLILIFRTRFRLVIVARASCWTDLYVILDNIVLFTPFNRRIVLEHRYHVSQS